MFAANAALMTGASLLPPTVTGISPTAGYGGSVTITGTNFVSGGTTVDHGGIAATSVVVNSAGTSLTCNITWINYGTHWITVTTPAGAAYTTYYSLSAASVSSVQSPSGGGTPYASDATWYVNGSGFLNARINPASSANGGGNQSGTRTSNSSTSTFISANHGLSGLVSGQTVSLWILNSDGGGSGWFNFTLR